jgi:hypothetical protein
MGFLYDSLGEASSAHIFVIRCISIILLKKIWNARKIFDLQFNQYLSIKMVGVTVV